MGVLIDRADFVGDVKLATNQNTEADVDAYISQWEEFYLRELLGVELYALFKANLTGQVPTDPIYLNIFNPIVSDDIDGQKYNSIGMKKTILNILWFLIVRDTKAKFSTGGPGVHEVETMREESYDRADIYRRWNDAVGGAEAIQAYIKNKPDIYPTYKGSCNEFQIISLFL